MYIILSEGKWKIAIFEMWHIFFQTDDEFWREKWYHHRVLIKESMIALFPGSLVYLSRHLRRLIVTSLSCENILLRTFSLFLPFREADYNPIPSILQLEDSIYIITYKAAILIRSFFCYSYSEEVPLVTQEFLNEGECIHPVGNNLTAIHSMKFLKANWYLYSFYRTNWC